MWTLADIEANASDAMKAQLRLNAISQKLVCTGRVADLDMFQLSSVTFNATNEAKEPRHISL